MSDFPILKTGAVLQYPAQKAHRFSTQVLRFVDGSEQRFRDYKTPLRRWMIKLDLLDESELQALREFFRTQGGAAGSFAFTDPWDGVAYPKCNLEDDEMVEDLLDDAKGKTTLSVMENRG